MREGGREGGRETKIVEGWCFWVTTTSALFLSHTHTHTVSLSLSLSHTHTHTHLDVKSSLFQVPNEGETATDGIRFALPQHLLRSLV